MDAWVHDLSPWVLRISESFGIRWYGVSYVAGFAAGWLLLRMLAQRGLVRIPADRVLDAILILVAGVLVGGRLGYCLVYRPELLVDFSGSFPFWGVLQLTKGGMASHGGIVGVIIAAWWVSRGFKTESGERVGTCPVLHVTDAVALVGPIGLGLGRLANFINGELLGKIVARPGERGPWWSVRFPQELLSGHAPELTAAQQAELSRLVIVNRLGPNEPDALVIERLIERVQAGSVETAAQLEPLLSARHPSQLYQAVAEGLVLSAVVWWVWRKPRVPGVVGAWFLISYGVLRVVTEVWRLPDAQFGGAGLLDAARPLGLSRGQWLSVGMVAAGAVLLVVVVRRGGERLGGWGRKTGH